MDVPTVIDIELKLIKRKPGKIVFRGAKRVLLESPIILQHDRELINCFLEIDAKKIIDNVHRQFFFCLAPFKPLAERILSVI